MNNAKTLDAALQTEVAGINKNQQEISSQIEQADKISHAGENRVRLNSRSFMASRDVFGGSSGVTNSFAAVLDPIDTTSETRTLAASEGGQTKGVSTTIMSADALLKRGYELLAEPNLGIGESRELFHILSSMLSQLTTMNEADVYNDGYAQARQILDQAFLDLARAARKSLTMDDSASRDTASAVLSLYASATSGSIGPSPAPLLHALAGSPSLRLVESTRLAGNARTATLSDLKNTIVGWSDSDPYAPLNSTTSWKEKLGLIAGQVNERLRRLSKGGGEASGALVDLVFDPFDGSQWRKLGTGVMTAMSALDSPSSVAQALDARAAAQATETAELAGRKRAAALSASAAEALASASADDVHKAWTSEATRLRLLSEGVKRAMGAVSMYDNVLVTILGDPWTMPAIMVLADDQLADVEVPDPIMNARLVASNQYAVNAVAALDPIFAGSNARAILVALGWVLLRIRSAASMTETSGDSIAEAVIGVVPRNFRNAMRAMNMDAPDLDTSTRVVLALGVAAGLVSQNDALNAAGIEAQHPVELSKL